MGAGADGGRGRGVSALQDVLCCFDGSGGKVRRAGGARARAGRPARLTRLVCTPPCRMTP